MALAAYSEDVQGDLPDAADLAEWVAFYQLSYPVLADPDGAVDRIYDPNTRSRPTHVLLGPGAVVLTVGGDPSAEEIEGALP